MPTNCEHTFNGFDLLYALLSTYKVLITDENSDDHARVLRDFRIDFLKWHVKRLIPTFFLYIGGIVVIAVYHWSKWDGSTEDTIRNFILYAGGFIAAAAASRLAVSRLGFMSATMLLAVVYSLMFYLYIVTLEKVNVLEQTLSSDDNIALVICALLGVFVADLKYPSLTVRSLITRDAIRLIYRQMIVPASLVVAPAFGVLKVTEYVIERIFEDFRSATILVPIAGMVIVALLELIRRELEQNDSP